MYKTNQQCWDEVTRSFQESKRRTQICQEMFGQDNLIGLTNDQRDLFWRSIWCWFVSTRRTGAAIITVAWFGSTMISISATICVCAIAMSPRAKSSGLRSSSADLIWSWTGTDPGHGLMILILAKAWSCNTIGRVYSVTPCIACIALTILYKLNTRGKR